MRLEMAQGLKPAIPLNSYAMTGVLP